MHFLFKLNSKLYSFLLCVRTYSAQRTQPSMLLAIYWAAPSLSYRLHAICNFCFFFFKIYRYRSYTVRCHNLAGGDQLLLHFVFVFTFVIVN